MQKVGRASYMDADKDGGVRRHSLAELLEKDFILDGVALSKQANDEIGRTQPSLNIGIPQYSALNDPGCKHFFQSTKAKKSKTESRTVFIQNSEAQKYLNDRKKIGAGYTRRLYGGHLTVPTAPPKQGYHGDEGYRRNTPDLRLKPSVFDYEDPFEHPRLLIRRNRIQSAPATVQLLRAKIYRQVPTINNRATSALPTLIQTRQLATGPPT